MIRIPCLLLASSLFLLSSTGCSSLSLLRTNASSGASVSSQPARCLCLWQPVNGADLTGNPIRGFGGQVYFFDAGSEEPIEVDGDVRVFIFDDIGEPAQQARPKDVQDFDSFVWKSFLNKSQVGTNYTVFVPYAQASKYESVCSLRLRLDQPDGTQVFSDMATVKLSGEPREDKSIRQLVSPREHSISPERSRELQVDIQQQRDSSDRARTIGSIKEGSLSLSNDDATDNEILDDHARLRIQRYESQLAEMHDEYEQNDGRQASHSTRSLEDKISDLMPAIRKVSRGRTKPRQRVRPAAHEVFAAEEPRHVEHADFSNDRSQSSVWGEDRFKHASQPTSSSRSEVKIQTSSRPLNRRRNSVKRPVWSDDAQLQALQLARISE
ncbi:MAG: hypothetical protein ACKVHE_05365 [Planctomycetales bacterium]|jgi:hypothetical protein